MDDFVNSKAMIAPGVAGSATTMITATLVTTFGFPGAVTALAVSFVFGLMVLADKTLTIFNKLLFYVINSMIIFSVAVGLNQSGMAIIERDKPISTIERSLESADEKQPDSTVSESTPFFQEWF